MTTRELRILTVDDEASVNHSVRFALGGPGRIFGTAVHGEDALTQIQAKNPPYDVVVIDHRMPLVNGIELVRRLRAISFAGKIIVLSAHLDHEARRTYEEMNVDVMLAKPFDVRELRETVERVVRDLG